MAQPSIVISYSVNDKGIADLICRDLQAIGVTLIRDVSDTSHTDNFKDFIQKIRNSSFIVMIISDAFLKSAYCMYEMVKLKTSHDLAQRILPVILEGTFISTQADMAAYKNYWQNKQGHLQETKKKLKSENSTGDDSELNKIFEIINYIMDFFSSIQQSSSLTLMDLRQTNYRRILSKIRPDDSSLLEELLKIQKMNDKEDQDIAIEDFMESHPKYAPSYILRSYLEYDSNNYKKSIRYYSKAKELDSEVELWCPPPGILGI